MDLENIMFSEISWTEKDKYCMISHIWNLKNNKNECICKTEVDSQLQKTTCDYRRGEGSWEGQVRSMGLTDTNYYLAQRITPIIS